MLSMEVKTGFRGGGRTQSCPLTTVSVTRASTVSAIDVAFHADVLRGSSRVAGTREEPLRTSAWEATIDVLVTRIQHHVYSKVFYF